MDLQDLQNTEKYEYYKYAKEIFNSSLNSRAKIVQQLRYDIYTKGPFESVRVASLNAQQQEHAIKDADQKIEEMKSVQRTYNLLSETCILINDMESADSLSSEKLANIQQNIKSLSEELCIQSLNNENKKILKQLISDIDSTIQNESYYGNISKLQNIRDNLQSIKETLPYQDVEAAKEEMFRQRRDAFMQLEANLDCIEEVFKNNPELHEMDYEQNQRTNSQIDLTRHTAREVAKHAIAQQVGLPSDAVEGILRQAAQDPKQQQIFLQTVQQIRDMGLNFLQPLISQPQIEGSEENMSNGNGEPSKEEVQDAIAGYLEGCSLEEREYFLEELKRKLEK